MEKDGLWLEDRKVAVKRRQEAIAKLKREMRTEPEQEKQKANKEEKAHAEAWKSHRKPMNVPEPRGDEENRWRRRPKRPKEAKEAKETEARKAQNTTKAQQAQERARSRQATEQAVRQAKARDKE